MDDFDSQPILVSTIKGNTNRVGVIMEWVNHRIAPQLSRLRFASTFTDR